MNAEFNAEKQRLQLPPGVAWPARARAAGPDDLYGAGMGTSEADKFWYCSWAREWLKQQPASLEAAREALRRLQTVKSLPLYTIAYSPEVQRETDKELAGAEKGDPQPLRESVTNNC